MQEAKGEGRREPLKPKTNLEPKHSFRHLPFALRPAVSLPNTRVPGQNAGVTTNAPTAAPPRVTIRAVQPRANTFWFLAGLSVVALLGLFLFPFATVSRGFSGEGTLLVHPGNIVNFANFKPDSYPDFSASTLAGWFTMLTVIALVALAFMRSRFVGWAGALVMLSVALQLGLMVHAIDVVQFPLLEKGVAYRRLAFQNFGPNLGAVVLFLAGAYGVVVGLSHRSDWAKRIYDLRGGIVPTVSLLLAIVVGGIVILTLQPTPGTAPDSSLGTSWFGRVDLLWYAYSSLFGPLLPRFRPAFDLAGLWLSLTQATPLIFTGLSLAFAFRASLFNIGAPGQIIFGAIFSSAVGIYVPGPWVIVAPLAIIAAAVGGAFWGAIPGWLKARFGSSEVINTIMLNAIASSILVFLIGSNKASFFGQTITLPFKAPGGEAKSLELGAGAHLNTLISVMGLKAGDNAVNLAIPLAILGLIIGVLIWRGLARARTFHWAIPPVAFAVLGAVIGLIAGNINVLVSGSMASARLNLSFLIALAAAAFYGVFMWRTKYGFEIRALGLSPKAAEYGGVNVARNTILAMAISGALAGLASTHYVLGGALEEFRLKQTIPVESAGFGGITVALLGANTPLGVITSSILFGVMNTGGLNLAQSLTKISREVVTVLQALIVLFIAAQGFLSGDFFRAINKPYKEDEAVQPNKLEEAAS
jgi:general nucleoside transport system permease protein